MDVTDDDTVAKASLQEKQPRLSTGMNGWIIGYYFTTISFLGVAFNAFGLLLYLRWGASFLWLTNAALIQFMGATGAQIILAEVQDSWTNEKYGRRKPFIIFSMILILVSFLLACFPPGKHTAFINFWWTLLNFSFGIGNGVLIRSFLAWLVESSVDAADFRMLNSIILNVGLLIGGLLALLLSIFQKALWLAVVAIILTPSATFLLMTKVPNDVYRAVEKVPPLVPSCRLVSRTNEFRTFFMSYFLYTCAFTVIGTAILVLLFLNFHINKNADVINYEIIIGLTSGIIGILLTIGCNWLFARIEKWNIFCLLLMFEACVAFISFIPSSVRTKPALYALVALMVLAGIPYTTMSLATTLFIRDLVKYDVFITGLNRENMYMTVINVPVSVGSNILLAFVTALINMSGYSAKTQDDDNLDQIYSYTTATLWICRFLFVFGGLFYLAATYTLQGYPLREKFMTKIDKVNKYIIFFDSVRF